MKIWVTTKMTKADSGKIPDVDVSIHERCGSKLTKADFWQNLKLKKNV
jgi:hypothetical protein